jgi:hypothetical protein
MSSKWWTGSSHLPWADICYKFFFFFYYAETGYIWWVIKVHKTIKTLGSLCF